MLMKFNNVPHIAQFVQIPTVYKIMATCETLYFHQDGD